MVLLQIHARLLYHGLTRHRGNQELATGSINGFVSGRDFSRAVMAAKNRWALAPVVSGFRDAGSLMRQVLARRATNVLLEKRNRPRVPLVPRFWGPGKARSRRTNPPVALSAS